MLEGRIVEEGAVGELTREQVVKAYFGHRQAQDDGVPVP